jgi:hypothetical protein
MANWVNQRLRVFGSKADLEKFYKKTSTKESHFDLWHIHELVDGFECNSRDFERSDQIEIQDIAQKDFPKKINSKLQGKQYSQIETAWGWRPELYLKLSQLFPNLILEVYYVEEGPAFVGAALYQKSQLYGESIANIELEGLIYLDEAEEEFDWDQMESMHLKNIYAGQKVDHDLRAKKINENRENQREQYKENQKKSLSDVLNDIQKNNYSTKDAKKYEQKIIDVLTYDNANLDVIPKKILTNNIIIALLDKKSSEGSKLTENECSDKLIMQLCQRGMAREISNLPKQMHQPQQLQTLLQNVKHSLNLKSIPENMRTNAVCWAGLEKGDVRDNFELIPSKILTPEMIKFAVQQNALIDKLDPKLITKELAELAVNTKPETFKFVPINLQSEKLVNIALASSGIYNYLKLSVDHLKNPKIRNKKILRKILLKNIGYKLDTLSEDELMMIFGGREGSGFITKLLEQGSIEQIVKNIPEKFIQKSHRKKIKEKDPVYGYPYLSDVDKTLDLTLKYIDITRLFGGKIKDFECIPLKYRNSAVLEKLLKKQANAHKFDYISKLSHNFIQQDTISKRLDNLNFPFQLFPPKAFTKEHIKYIKDINNYPSFIDVFLPKKFQDLKNIKKELKKDFSLFLYLTPELKKSFTEDVILNLKHKLNKKSNPFKQLLELKPHQKIEWLTNQSKIMLILRTWYTDDSFREDAAKSILLEQKFLGKKANIKIYDQALKLVQKKLSKKEYEFILFHKFFYNPNNKLDKILINYPKILCEMIRVGIASLSVLSKWIEGSPKFTSGLEGEKFKLIFAKLITKEDSKVKIDTSLDDFHELSDTERKDFYQSPLSSLKTKPHYFVNLNTKTQNDHSFIVEALKVNTDIINYIPTNYITNKTKLLKLLDNIKNIENITVLKSKLISIVGTKTKFFNDFSFIKKLIAKNHLNLQDILPNLQHFKLDKNFLLFLSKQIK